MIALVTGGASSGKSEFAERLALSLPGPHVYAATMRREGAEAEERIARHRLQREGAGFKTVELNEMRLAQRSTDDRLARMSCLTVRPAERSRSLGGAAAAPSAPFSSRHETSMSRLTSSNLPNAALRPVKGTVLLEDLGNLLLNGLEDSLDAVLASENAVIVTNEIGCDGVSYEGFTQDFIERLGRLSCQIASQADMVVEVVCGVPTIVR